MFYTLDSFLQNNPIISFENFRYVNHLFSNLHAMQIYYFQISAFKEIYFLRKLSIHFQRSNVNLFLIVLPYEIFFISYFRFSSQNINFSFWNPRSEYFIFKTSPSNLFPKIRGSVSISIWLFVNCFFSYFHIKYFSTKLYFLFSSLFFKSQFFVSKPPSQAWIFHFQDIAVKSPFENQKERIYSHLTLSPRFSNAIRLCPGR